MVEDEVNVVIVDAQFYNMSLTEFVDNILQVQPAYIGISILSTEYKETLHIAVQALREHLPDAVVIAGGVHATIEYMDVIADPGIDFVVRGNGESHRRNRAVDTATPNCRHRHVISGKACGVRSERSYVTCLRGGKLACVMTGREFTKLLRFRRPAPTGVVTSDCRAEALTPNSAMKC
jgi:hypothetical protein